MQRLDHARTSHETAAPALPHVVLEITRGRASHKARLVRGPAFVIGTAPDCDLVLADARFADWHSYLHVGPRSVTIRQLGPGPALRVAGRDVSWAELVDHDLLAMGPYEFRVRIDWPVGKPGAASVGQSPLDRLRPPADDDVAAERLLHDVEQFSAAPRLSLYVEEGRPDAVQGGSAARKACCPAPSVRVRSGHSGQR